jgi:PEP-CTERM motif
MKRAAILVVAAMVLASPVLGDWNEGDPHKMHDPQLPDVSLTGIDVDNSILTLADDFLCTESGPITDVHLWGSFADDILPVNGVDWLSLHLEIWSDVPAQQSPTDYSTPGAPLWSHDICGPMGGPNDGFTVRLYADNVDEFFWDPATGAVTNDHQCYQYNIYINEDVAFVQEEGNVYWLVVKAESVCPDATFGWKTSLDHWNDDAVYWTDGMGWQELRYPAWHPLHPESIDLAFVITPEPASLSLLILGAVAVVGRRRR